jgi:hypothetical protein
MTMKSPDALKEDVRRTKIRDQKIEVDVETLLDSLSRDKDASRRGARPAKKMSDLTVEAPAIRSGETRVVEGRNPLHVKEKVGSSSAFTLEGDLSGYGVGDKVAQDEHAAAMGGLVQG